MTFKQAAVLAPVCFFLGVLFICMNVDHRTLWGPLTDDAVADATHFYTTFYNAPQAIKALLHGMIGVGLVGLLAKMFKWDDSALFFDGSSLAAYVFAIVVYLTVTVASLRTVVTPLAGVETAGDQVMALRVLAAGHAIIIACLGLVLLLQGGQEWAARTEAQAVAEWEAAQKKDQ